MNNKELITKWVLEKVEEEYKDDIALVVSHNTLRLESEKGTPSVSYFIPITDKGRRFARTFILDGVGIDLWGIEWERMEQFADLNEYNISCLADSQVLYARTPEDRERFENLKKRQGGESFQSGFDAGTCSAGIGAGKTDLSEYAVFQRQ